MYQFDDLQASDNELFASSYEGHSADEVAYRRARFHSAMSILLSEYGVGNDDIREQVLFDSADQGIDFLFISEDETPRVYVVQAKDHKTFGSASQIEAVEKMHREIARLNQLSPNKARNEVDQVFDRWSKLRQIKPKKEDLEPIFIYVLLLTNDATVSITKDSCTFLNENEELLLLDRSGLIDYWNELTFPPPTDVTIEFAKAAILEKPLTIGHKLLNSYVDVITYSDATEKHGIKLFRLNPRLFLSRKRGANTDMLRTLENPSDWQNFHIFNNGITATCRDFEKVDETSDQVVYKFWDFQVVNGCQTTESLWHWNRIRDSSSSRPQVQLKVIVAEEDLSLRISTATNNQSAITAADLVANDDHQKAISLVMKNFPTSPYIYENRRGTWAQVKNKANYLIPKADWPGLKGNNYRKIDIREMGQALLAVLGNPNRAKEQIASVFKNPKDGSEYEALFGQHKSWTSAIQLLLLADLYKLISATKVWLPDNASEQERELASLGRFYILYLTYEYIRTEGKPFDKDPKFDRTKLFDEVTSGKIRSDLFNTCRPILQAALKALDHALENPPEGIEIDGKRAFLRQSIHKKHIESTFKIYAGVKATMTL
jgi:hypothetical protein